MPETLLIGSNNRDKAAELRTLLADSNWNVKSLADFDTVPEPLEDADTFEGNARLKARYFVERFGVPCVADDSGLEVDALDGVPGVYSARYAGEDCSYTDNNRKLLEALRGVPQEKRTAHFICCAAFIAPDGREHTVLGTVQGSIAFESLGTNGFGYDPLFIPEGSSQTFAQMDPEEKHRISHRGRAFAKMRSHLESIQ